MNLNNDPYNQVSSQIRLNGLNNSTPVKNIQGVASNLPVSQVSSDGIVLNGLGKAGKIPSTVPSNVLDQISENVDQLIASYNEIPDTSLRSAKLRDLYITLLDNDDFVGAAKAINATPSLIYKNSMFKGLVQELIADGNYNQAIALTNNYPDTRIKAELQQEISSYFNNYVNDSTLAAKAQGDESIGNIVSLKAQSIFGSVGNFFSGMVDSATSFVSTPTRANQLAKSAESIVGKRFRYDFLDGGNLACAYSVSQALKGVPGLSNVSSSECNSLADKLQKAGFQKVYSNGTKPIQGNVSYKPGDIVFFTRSKKEGYGHVGIVAEVRNGVPYMVHNSSSKREVVKVRLDQYYKTPVAVFRSPK